MDSHDEFSDDDIFAQITQGLKFSGFEIHEDNEHAVIERLLIDRCRELPKIHLADILENWLEIRSETDRYVLRGIGITEVGILCEVIQHDDGTIQYFVVQGSIASFDETLVPSEILGSAAAYFSDISNINTDDGSTLTIVHPESEERVATLLFDNQHVMRDAYLQMRPAFLINEITKLFKDNPSLRSLPLHTESVQMPSGMTELVFVDMSTFCFEVVVRTRLINDESGETVDGFGRADARDWNHNK